MTHPQNTLFLFAITLTQSAVLFSQPDALPPKVSNAETLFLDLVRDLGARKGEKEFNIGAHFRDFETYSENAFFAEYEFAPINRLGVEAEADFSFYDAKPNEIAPENKLDYIGIEVNQEVDNDQWETVLHPQVKPKLDKHTAVGLVTGCLMHRAKEGFSSFVRLIYEP